MKLQQNCDIFRNVDDLKNVPLLKHEFFYFRPRICKDTYTDALNACKQHMEMKPFAEAGKTWKSIYIYAYT